MQRLTTCLRDLSREQCQPQSGPALIAIGRVVNWVIKVRGWKAVGESSGETSLKSSPAVPVRYSLSTFACGPLVSTHIAVFVEDARYAPSSFDLD